LLDIVAHAADIGFSRRLTSKSWTWKIQWLVIALAAFAVIVGGIIGGLDWIKLH